jgi:hypothetical protein
MYFDSKIPNKSFHDSRHVWILLNAIPFLSVSLGDKELGPAL